MTNIDYSQICPTCQHKVWCDNGCPPIDNSELPCQVESDRIQRTSKDFNGWEIKENGAKDGKHRLYVIIEGRVTTAKDAGSLKHLVSIAHETYVKDFNLYNKGGWKI